MRALVALVLVCLGPPLLAGCFSIGAVDAGPGGTDGGTIDVSRRDAGPPDPPRQDSGPPPVQDAGGPPQVRITTFAADTTSLAFLGATQLRWSVAAASSCALDPNIATVTLPVGSVEIAAENPGDVQSFTLTCQGEGGPVSAQETITTVLVEQAGATVASVAQLGAFAGVNVVTGDLIIDGVPALANLSVLERLVEVEGSLVLNNNAALTTVDLPNLTRVGRALAIDGQDVLETLDLPALERIESKLYLSRNPQLPQSEIDDLVTAVQGELGIGGAVIDYYNEPVTVIGSLSQTMLCTHSSLDDLFLVEFSPFGFDIYASNGAGGYNFAGTGTYDENQGQLRMVSPNFQGPSTQTSSNIEIEYDRVTSFQNQDFSLCWLTSVPGQGALITSSFDCPFATTGPYEERNTVIISLEGQAQWDYTVVENSSGGQQTDSLPGAFVIDDDWLLFAFPRSVSPLYSLRYPTGRLNAQQNELHIEELPDTMTPCTLQ